MEPHWEWRVLKDETSDGRYFRLHEVYLDAEGVVVRWDREGAESDWSIGDIAVELIDVYAAKLRALSAPVLDYGEMPS